MHGRHSSTANGLCIIFGCIIQPLLAGHAHTGAVQSKWPTETTLAVVEGNHSDVAQALTLEQMH